MAIIHRTTMTPTKLELLSSWLPTQPWYLGTVSVPVLSRTGGFRLDDPEGEVGIEFLVITDESGPAPVSYHVPLSYRGAALDGAEQALIGVCEHGVLGQRWVYDGTHDPVLVAQLLALLQGRAEPQAQSQSHTPDPSVTVRFTGTALTSAVVAAAATTGPHGTRITLDTTGCASPAPLTIGVVRVLDPAGTAAAGATGHVSASWRAPDGGEHRAVFAVLHRTGS